MGKFRDFLEAAGLTQTNLVTLDRRASMATGRDKAEPFVKAQLARYGINIVGAGSYHEDAVLKIDGYWDGAPVQIKIRTSKAPQDRNDIAYELVRSYLPDVSVGEQLKDPQRWGKDLRGKAEHYFMMDQKQEFIYHILASDLKQIASMLTTRLDHLYARGQRFSPGRPTAVAVGGIGSVSVNCVVDRDAEYYHHSTGYKLMAFIPVAGALISQRFPVQDLSTPSQTPVGPQQYPRPLRPAQPPAGSQ